MAIVYEHLRNDTNEVFYVGIGKAPRRAFSKQGRNNPHWHNIAKKVGYSVNIIHSDIEWDEAGEIEKSLIKKYGRQDLRTGILVNMTDGGDGRLGVIVSEETRLKIGKSHKGRIPSEEARQKMSEAHKGKTPSEETRLKLSEAHKGKTASEETRLKMSKDRIGEKNNFFGKTHSEEAKQKLSESGKERIGEKNGFFGKTHSEEAKQKIGESSKERIGEKNHFFGKKHSEESIHRMTYAQRNRKNVRGYVYREKEKKYETRITVRGKTKQIGTFNTPEEAAEAYQKARLIYFV